MLVVPQSFEILKDSDSLVDDIGKRARICYRSPPAEDESKFVLGIIKSAHNSCLEMRTITLMFPYIHAGFVTDLTNSKYLVYDKLPEGTYCTGTVRAWREWIKVQGGSMFSMVVKHTLWDAQPTLFGDLGEIHQHTIPGVPAPTIITEVPKELIKRHTFQGVKFITNRAVTHEIVRHRPVTYLQESQRYCAYDKDKFGGQVTFIAPTAFFEKGTEGYTLWDRCMRDTEARYLKLLQLGFSAQAARTVLPNSCKTEIIVYCSLKQWEHIFAMRTYNTAVEPSMLEAMNPVLDTFKEMYPGMFDNICRSVG